MRGILSSLNKADRGAQRMLTICQLSGSGHATRERLEINQQNLKSTYEVSQRNMTV
jgi:hypothetical protein